MENFLTGIFKSFSLHLCIYIFIENQMRHTQLIIFLFWGAGCVYGNFCIMIFSISWTVKSLHFFLWALPTFFFYYSFTDPIRPPPQPTNSLGYALLVLISVDVTYRGFSWKHQGMGFFSMLGVEASQKIKTHPLSLLLPLVLKRRVFQKKGWVCGFFFFTVSTRS